MALLRKTSEEYQVRYLREVAFAERKLGRPASPMEVVECFLARDGELSPSSIRQARSAMIFGMRVTINTAPKVTEHVLPAIDALKRVDDRGRRAGPAPSRKADRKTSSRKRKSRAVEQAEATAASLGVSRYLHAELAAVFLRFGPDLGLRPAEWQTAEVEGLRLVLQNSKHTNGRSCGPWRVLELDAYPQAYRDELQTFLDKVRSVVAANEYDWDLVAEGVNRALRSAGNATGIGSLRAVPIVLYTLRHVATARMKAARGSDGKSARFSSIEIAAMLGHISPDTAGTHYARKHTGRGWHEMLTRPSPENVEIVLAAAARSEGRAGRRHHFSGSSPVGAGSPVS